MKASTLSAICIAIVLVVVVAGEMYAYIPDDRGFSADAGYDGTTVDYDVSAKGAYTYRSTLFDNGGMVPVSRVYIYLDSDYASFVDDGKVVAVGSQALTQEYYVDQLEKNLKIRGIDDITIVNAAELKDALTAGEPAGKGLVIASGAAPDTVFGASNDILIDWINGGGYLYWAAGPIGLFSATPDGLVTVNRMTDFIGTDSYVDDNGRCLEDTDLRPILYYNYMYARYAPDIDAVRDSGRTVLGTGYTDGEGHYTVTCVRIGAGQVCIHSGDYNNEQIQDISISVCSGLCPLTKVVDTKEAKFNRSASGTFETAVPAGMSVYIYIGQYYPVFGERFDL